MICSSPGTSTLEKTARQIYRIDFQPGLIETTTLITLPIKMSYHPNGTPARWLKALLQQQLPNCVASVQLEPKVAILKCCDFRLHPSNIYIYIYGNHMEIMPWFWEPNLTWFHHSGSEWHLRVQAKHASMSSSLSHPITPSFRAEWTAGKHLGHAKPSGIAWYRMVSPVKSQVFS